jgi:hypothetical protein
MNDSTSVIALAVAFGFAFLGVLQWVTNLIKNNDVERKALIKELDTVKVFNVDLQTSYNTLKIEHNDLSLRYNRLASAAKRIKDENDLLRDLATPESKHLTSNEITQIETEVSLDVQVQLDIENAQR